MAHLLSPDNVGAAVALATILGSCELLTDVGLNQFVIISRGNPAQSVAVARQIAITRSLIIGVIIVSLAPYLAKLFDANAEVWNIRWLGLVPLLRGLRNWRMIQIQKQYRYLPHAIANVSATAGSVVALAPTAILFHDARAMLVSLAVEAALYTLLSHLLVSAERVTEIDPAVRRAALAFGLPLIVNGVGLLVLSQADRIIVANLFGLATLALYSLALNLVIAPTSVLSEVVGSLALPFLGRHRDDITQSRQASLIVLLALLIGATFFALAVGLSLDWLLPLLYGPRYTISAEFCALIGIVVYLRVFRAGPNFILLAHGRTKRATAGNIVAGSGLLIGLLLASSFHRIEAVVFGLLIGDLISLIVLLCFAKEQIPIPRLLPHAGILALVVCAAAATELLSGGSALLVRAFTLVSACFVIVLEAFVVNRHHFANILAAPTSPPI